MALNSVNVKVWEGQIRGSFRSAWFTIVTFPVIIML